VTKTGGIIFVQNASNLAEALFDTPHEIIVSTSKGKEYIIKITINEAESNCTDEDIYSLCGRHEFKEDCEKGCGVGSKNGRCKWRSMREDNMTSYDNRTIYYETCVPDIEKCPNLDCDPLEKLAMKLSGNQGPHYYICSQDCTKGDVHGKIQSRFQGIGRTRIDHMCTCKDKYCHCGEPHRTTTTTTSTMSSIMNESDNVTNNDPNIDREFFSRNPDCGIVCIMVMIGCPALLLFSAIFFIFLRQHQVKKMKKRMLLNGSTVSYRDSNDTEIININIINEMAKENYFQTYQKFDFDTKWEFDRMKLILDATLGEGEFGKVMKAYASDLDGPNTLKTVAVKTIKTSHSTVELLALLSEFQLLQEVSHPNVIKLLGACIRGEPPLIIIEYCCHGSLRSYLRLSRKLDESGDLEIEGVEPVTAKDVLSFQWQICKGMAYLAEIKLVHRDLALRNVLLADGKVCKISDFGLTRDVYEDDAYLKKSKDRVPVKWMSPESLADHVYTTKTDVWSFGVVGWEIITLGATPYPGIPPQNLYHLLRNGYRMQRPENCSSEIYSLLEACWDENPNLRPSFKVLATQFEKLLGTCAKYLDVDVVDGAISNPLYISSNENGELKIYLGSKIFFGDFQEFIIFRFSSFS
jgi:proto-oncogene tyrosine-protein kinase Ret